MTASTDPAFDQFIDITADLCPMTFVRTRLALDRLASGAILKIRMTGDEPRQNVPRQAEALGHTVLHLNAEADGITVLWLRKH